eukprot:312982-Pyramimonas_sp.AAC.1
MRDLQKIPHAAPRDHCPLLWRLHYKLHFEPPQEVEPRWDYDQIAALLQHEGDLTFMAEIERLSERHE